MLPYVQTNSLSAWHAIAGVSLYGMAQNADATAGQWSFWVSLLFTLTTTALGVLLSPRTIDYAHFLFGFVAGYLIMTVSTHICISFLGS